MVDFKITNDSKLEKGMFAAIALVAKRVKEESHGKKLSAEAIQKIADSVIKDEEGKNHFISEKDTAAKEFLQQYTHKLIKDSAILDKQQGKANGYHINEFLTHVSKNLNDPKKATDLRNSFFESAQKNLGIKQKSIVDDANQFIENGLDKKTADKLKIKTEEEKTNNNPLAALGDLGGILTFLLGLLGFGGSQNAATGQNAETGSPTVAGGGQSQGTPDFMKLLQGFSGGQQFPVAEQDPAANANPMAGLLGMFNGKGNGLS